ncbi:uncharacterized protein A4U43_C04F13900 [Asparagus officinalis]|uniref:Uncharacterized protein n=1 Tax=Asparagus officinalis TaxID=4686 RepID=A0A5P1F2H8_ASPOF|nr:uncharacterized protein A4U43_C04F13900 [Asparagus officinalis]
MRIAAALVFFLISPRHRFQAPPPSSEPLPVQKLPEQSPPRRPPAAANRSGLPSSFSPSKRYEGSSDLIHLRYHMGPVRLLPVTSTYLVRAAGRRLPLPHPRLPPLHLLPSPPPPPLPVVLHCAARTPTNPHPTSPRSFTSAPSDSQRQPHPRPGPHRASPSAGHRRLRRLRPPPVDHRHGVYLVLTAPRSGSRSSAAPSRLPLLHLPSIVATPSPTRGGQQRGRSAPTSARTPSPWPGLHAGSGIGR